MFLEQGGQKSAASPANACKQSQREDDAIEEGKCGFVWCVQLTVAKYAGQDACPRPVEMLRAHAMVQEVEA